MSHRKLFDRPVATIDGLINGLPDLGMRIV
jgi:hypothetical protein